MVRLIVIIIAMFGSTTDEPRCRKTQDLIIQGSITHENGSEAELTGTIYNRSERSNYENIYIKADLFDDSRKKVGEFTFTLKDEAEAGRTIPFDINIADAEQVASVNYTVVCAEEDKRLLRF